MADFLSRYSNLAQVSDLQHLVEESGTLWQDWKLKKGLELGAGLGLPSIVASKLGAHMIATDGDDAALQLLRCNVARNAPQCQVKSLLWGSIDPLA